MRIVKTAGVCVLVILLAACGAKGPASDSTSVKTTPKPVSPKAPPAKPAPEKVAPAAQSPLSAPQAGAQGAGMGAISWDFRELDAGTWGWVFPGESPAKTADGVEYVAWQGQPGPVLRKTKINASGVTQVRVNMSLKRQDPKGKATSVPFRKIDFYFAKTEDSKPKDSWPFGTDRAVNLQPVPDEPGVYTAKVAGLGGWEGTLTDFFFDAQVPTPKPADKGKTPKYTVTVSKIEFLK